MRITVTKSGGYAGLPPTTTSVDTAALPADRARQLEGLVAQAGFFELPAKLPSPTGADFEHYVVAVADGGRQHSVEFDDDQGADKAALRALVQALR